jgi:hypothetical protein
MMGRIRDRDQVTAAKDSLRADGISEGFLCCRGLKLECGDMQQKWYGLFPPDRMHLW